MEVFRAGMLIGLVFIFDFASKVDGKGGGRGGAAGGGASVAGNFLSTKFNKFIYLLTESGC